jgi:hypothetical protein
MRRKRSASILIIATKVTLQYFVTHEHRLYYYILKTRCITVITVLMRLYLAYKNLYIFSWHKICGGRAASIPTWQRGKGQKVSSGFDIFQEQSNLSDVDPNRELSITTRFNCHSDTNHQNWERVTLTGGSA